MLVKRASPGIPSAGSAAAGPGTSGSRSDDRSGGSPRGSGPSSGSGTVVAQLEQLLVPVGRVLHGEEAVGEAQLVHRGVAGEGEERGHLRLPAEASDLALGLGRVLDGVHAVGPAADAGRRDASRRRMMSCGLMASTRPNPNAEGVMRLISTLASGGTNSRHSGEMASRCRSEPPSSARGSKGGPEFPKRVTTLAPDPPTLGSEWHAAQLSSFMMGPRPPGHGRTRARRPACRRRSAPAAAR